MLYLSPFYITKDEKCNTIMGQTTRTYAGKRVLPIPDFLMSSIMEQAISYK